MCISPLGTQQKIPQTEYMEALAQDGEQSVNYLDKYSESVQWLTKLTGNKRRFNQQGIQAATVIRCSS